MGCGVCGGGRESKDQRNSEGSDSCSAQRIIPCLKTQMVNQVETVPA